MDNRKEILILNGGGHKGVVKLQGDFGGEKSVKGSCSLDFRPSNAALYLVGDGITKIELNNTNCTFEVPFCAKTELGCVVRSSSITMFGGSIPNGQILKRIEEHNKQASIKQAAQNTSKESTFPCKAPQSDKGEKHAAMTLSDVAALDEWTKYDGNNFYYAIKPQLDELFICYPEEKALCEAVEGSKWIRVDAANESYVVGVLFNNDEPSFICYGVPADTSTAPPDELEGACVWLPVSDTSGYWVIYQSAQTGGIVK